MDYEKLHKETLERLQQRVREGKITEDVAKYICPDFVAESEDERIRKWLSDILDASNWRNDWPYTKQQVINYLEKQKDNKFAPRVLPCSAAWFEDGEEKKKDQKPVEWSEEDNDAFRRVLELLAFYEEETRQSPVLSDGDKEIIRWCEKGKKWLSDRFKFICPQPKVKWDEEDEDMIRQIERIAQGAGCTQKLQEEIHKWLKFRRPQPRWKTNAQEKAALRTAIHILTEERNLPIVAAQLQNILDAFEGGKSRKDWKPSKEQMGALKYELGEGGRFDKAALASLYNQLKKLM